MVKLTEDMKEAFSKVKIFPFATASKAGKPNVIPIGMCQLVDDETVWVIDLNQVEGFKTSHSKPSRTISCK